MVSSGQTPKPRREATPILTTPQASLLNGQRVFIEPDLYLKQLEKERDMLTALLADHQHTLSLYQSYQQAGLQVEHDLTRESDLVTSQKQHTVNPHIYVLCRYTQRCLRE
jgi:hypothetical protein